MAEDLDDHRRIFDGGPSTRLRTGDDLQSAAAVRAVFDVDVEDPLRSRAQLMRAGAPCARASSLEVSVARSGGAGTI
jgi:hypothetical protein